MHLEEGAKQLLRAADPEPSTEAAWANFVLRGSSRSSAQEQPRVRQEIWWQLPKDEIDGAGRRFNITEPFQILPSSNTKTRPGTSSKTTFHTSNPTFNLLKLNIK